MKRMASVVEIASEVNPDLEPLPEPPAPAAAAGPAAPAGETPRTDTDDDELASFKL